MARAGVVNLSDAVTTEVVEQTLLEPGGVLPTRLRARHRLLVRVLSHHDSTALERLSPLTSYVLVQRLAALTIQQSIDLEGTTHTSRPFERGALYLRRDGRFLWVDDGQTEPNWLEIARELLRAIDVEGPAASSVASVFRGVLAAVSVDIASQELDELGYPALDETDDDVAEPGITDGFGGAGAREDEPTDARPEAEHDDHTPGSEHDPNGGSSPGEPEGDAPRNQPMRGEPAHDGPGTGSSGVDTEQPALNEPGQAGVAGSRTAGRSTPESAATRQSRLRSYVVPSEVAPAAPSRASSDIDSQVDAAAIAAVLAYEREHGRVPSEMDHSNPGYDVRSEDTSGTVRFIEVKGDRCCLGRGQGSRSPAVSTCTVSANGTASGSTWSSRR